jgi:tetratricopeptide (TPR) repeat protein
MGNSETAEKELTQARQLQQQLLQNKPDDPQRLKPLADSFNALGSFYNSQRQYKTSTQMFEETIALRAKLAKADPENLEFQRLRANAVMNLGLAKLQAGDASGANNDMLSAQASRQELLDKDPTATRVRRDLAMGWYSLGKSQASREQASPEELEAAIVYLRKAIREFDVLLASDPRSMSNRYYLGVSHRLLGGMLAERREFTAAAEAYEAATKPIQSLAVGNPEVAAYRAELAVLAMNRGTVYTATEKFVPAREAWEQAQKLTAELMEHDPEDPQLRTDLANSLAALGDLHRRDGQKDQAIACFEQAQEQLRILRERDPQNNWLKSLWDENQESIQDLKSDTLEPQPKPMPCVDSE